MEGKRPGGKPKKKMLDQLMEQDQLRRAKERSREPGRMAPSSLEPALG